MKFDFEELLAYKKWRKTLDRPPTGAQKLAWLCEVTTTAMAEAESDADEKRKGT